MGSNNKAIMIYNKDFLRDNISLKSSKIDEAERYDAYLEYGKPQPVTQGTFYDYVRTYSVVPYVFICANIISANGASVKIKIFDKVENEEEDRKEIISHKCMKLLKNPNPFMTKRRLFEATFGFLELTGNAYWEIVRDGDGIPIELYPLQSQRIVIVPDSKDKVKGYLYNLESGGQLRFEAKDILHFSTWHPENDFYGLSRIAAAENSIINDTYARNYNKYFFKNSARPDAVLQAKDSLNDDMYKRLHREWENAHRGVSKAHRIAILEAGLEYKQISLSQKDMDYIKGRKLDKEDIFAIFGVPLSMAGIGEKGSYASRSEDKKWFWEESMLPRLAAIEETIDIQLLPEFDNKSDFEFDLFSIAALRENAESAARISATMVDRGIFTINEARKRYWRMSKISGGDVATRQANVLPIESGREPANELQNQATGKPMGNKPPTLPSMLAGTAHTEKLAEFDNVLEKVTDDLLIPSSLSVPVVRTKQEAEKARRSFLKIHKSFEDRFVDKLKIVFSKQEKMISDNINKLAEKGIHLREVLLKDAE